MNLTDYEPTGHGLVHGTITFSVDTNALVKVSSMWKLVDYIKFNINKF